MAAASTLPGAHEGRQAARHQQRQHRRHGQADLLEQHVHEDEGGERIVFEGLTELPMSISQASHAVHGNAATEKGARRRAAVVSDRFRFEMNRFSFNMNPRPSNLEVFISDLSGLIPT